MLTATAMALAPEREDSGALEIRTFPGGPRTAYWVARSVSEAVVRDRRLLWPPHKFACNGDTAAAKW
jgi:hypothetical protein